MILIIDSIFTILLHGERLRVTLPIIILLTLVHCIRQELEMNIHKF